MAAARAVVSHRLLVWCGPTCGWKSITLLVHFFRLPRPMHPEFIPSVNQPARLIRFVWSIPALLLLVLARQVRSLESRHFAPTDSQVQLALPTRTVWAE